MSFLGFAYLASIFRPAVSEAGGQHGAGLDFWAGAGSDVACRPCSVSSDRSVGWSFSGDQHEALVACDDQVGPGSSFRQTQYSTAYSGDDAADGGHDP